MSIYIIVPSLKISGGNRESLRLAKEFNLDGIEASIVSMWVSPNEMTSPVVVKYLSSWSTRPRLALLELPLIASRFVRLVLNAIRPVCFFIFTHYSTLPLAFIVRRDQRLFFVQDLEWNFVGNSFLSRLLRIIILTIYRTGRVVSANCYITERLSQEGIKVELEAPIWADASFLTQDSSVQDIDFAMVLRKGDHKRLDLYLRFINLASFRRMRIAVVTPEDDIAKQVYDQVDILLLRPQHHQMLDLYSRSVCFLHLSEHEGFGLPPLEAMGAGCTPLCRDSGGVSAFMRDGPFADLLLPLSLPLEKIFEHAETVLLDSEKSSRREAARKWFKEGLLRSEQARKGLVAAIASRSQQ